MQAFNRVAANVCHYPKQTYRPDDLADDQQEALLLLFRLQALYDGLGEDAAEEAASVFYLHWRTRDYSRCDIARGEHARAYYAIRRYARLSNWQGFTGQRRAKRRTITEGMLSRRERMRERNNPTPDSVAIAVERIAKTPKHSGKAYRLAKSLGLPGVRELVREACGFAAE